MEQEEKKNEEKDIDYRTVTVKPCENLVNKKIKYGIIGEENCIFNSDDQVKNFFFLLNIQNIFQKPKKFMKIKRIFALFLLFPFLIGNLTNWNENRCDEKF